ncbi:MAG TPA: hypothetical protein VF075_12065 [Pyrinomonadaceae bacterium]
MVLFFSALDLALDLFDFADNFRALELDFFVFADATEARLRAGEVLLFDFAFGM